MKNILACCLMSALSGISSCTAQPHHHTTQTTLAMRHFDKATFDKNSVDDEYLFTNVMGATIRQLKVGDTYTEEITTPNSPYAIAYEYFADGALKVEAKGFQALTVGVYKEYDEAGKLILEFDHEKAFPFSIEALAGVVEREYGLNLMDKEFRPRVVLERRLKPNPIYLVKWRDAESHLLRAVVYDGATGRKILEEEDGKEISNKPQPSQGTPGTPSTPDTKTPGRRFNVFD